MKSLTILLAVFHSASAFAQPPATPEGLDAIDATFQSYLSFGKTEFECTDQAQSKISGKVISASTGNFQLQLTFNLDGFPLLVDLYRTPTAFHQSTNLANTQILWRAYSDRRQISNTGYGEFGIEILKAGWYYLRPETLQFLPTTNENWIIGIHCKMKNPIRTL